MASGIEFYSKNETPYGKSYDSWIADFWNWDASILNDPSNEVYKFKGLTDNGCLIKRVNSTVMLMDTALGFSITQKCTISHNDGILIPIWSGECDKSMEEITNYKDLLDCARAADKGKVTGIVTVDNIPVARLDATDLNARNITNVMEMTSQSFNITYPLDGHLDPSKNITTEAAAHGWFVFLKPLAPGDHTIYYRNVVQAGTSHNEVEITYHLKVE